MNLCFTASYPINSQKAPEFAIPQINFNWHHSKPIFCYISIIFHKIFRIYYILYAKLDTQGIVSWYSYFVSPNYNSYYSGKTGSSACRNRNWNILRFSNNKWLENIGESKRMFKTVCWAYRSCFGWISMYITSKLKIYIIINYSSIILCSYITTKMQIN